ncbi:MAG: hypothetical protein LBH71_00455 [Oscillospiraceae bacterium]|jgi:hypothetical protein|nr:hypothetical protein [Oscillospiraceae bacterium]
MQDKFTALRDEYNSFIYNGFEISHEDDFIKIIFNFEIENLCSFGSTVKIKTDNLKLVNNFDDDTAKKIIFNLGMVELISYWKCACPKNVEIRCGSLDDMDCKWWKKLYFNGLGEFFYLNGIDTDIESFMDIKAQFSKSGARCNFSKSDINIIPIGGGKDSNVTLELLHRGDNLCFTVNDQPAREESVLASGLKGDKIIRTYRTIDPKLLHLNSAGFFNGHTPFSAIVAFLGLYCAYITGGSYIVLSNESSANESNIEGTDINHQYSKSFEFECDFNSYVRKNITGEIHYFSLLRPFNELQIAKQFSVFKRYHHVFKSCNAGSKKNIWCCNCAKCLFVYIILSPFIKRSELVSIFGQDMLDKTELIEIFDGLTGFADVKPFECIGTKREINAALLRTYDNMVKSGEAVPKLLDYYSKRVCDNRDDFSALMKEYNEENNIPQDFLKYVKGMYEFVSKCD